MAVLSLKGINLKFGQNQILKDVDFELAAGSIHALLGQNGAGKSSLVKVIAGDYLPQSGELRLFNELQNFAVPRDAIDAGISIIHQELELIDHLTVADNIFLGQELRTGFGSLSVIDDKKQLAESAALLEQIGLDIKPDTLVAELSLPQKQLIEILRAFYRKAKVIILDEPTSALSVKDAAKILEYVTDAQKRLGLSFIYITHRFDELSVCDTVTILRDGVNVYHGSVPSNEAIVDKMTGGIAPQAAPERATGVTGASFAVSGLSGATVRDIELRAEAGEVVGIVGLADSGIYELPRLIFGAVERTAGTVFLNGKNITPQNPTAAKAAGLAYLSEDRKADGLCPVMDVRSNTTLSFLKQYTRYFTVSEAAELTATAGSKDRLQGKWSDPLQPVATLSGGNQQKVLVGRWLLGNPEVLLIAEPTRGIDVAAKAEIYTLLKNLAASGKVVIIASSEVEEVLSVAGRIVALKDGRIISDQPTAATNYEEIMGRAF